METISTFTSRRHFKTIQKWKPWLLFLKLRNQTSRKYQWKPTWNIHCRSFLGSERCRSCSCKQTSRNKTLPQMRSWKSKLRWRKACNNWDSISVDFIQNLISLYGALYALLRCFLRLLKYGGEAAQSLKAQECDIKLYHRKLLVQQICVSSLFERKRNQSRSANSSESLKIDIK